MENPETIEFMTSSPIVVDESIGGSSEELKNKLHEDVLSTIDSVFTLYDNDIHMIQKIHQYICNQFPGLLDKFKRTREYRIQQNEDMTTEQENFIQTFLNNNQYFYIPSTEKFIHYNGLSYQCIEEDKILYTILSTISRSRDGNLMTWKQRTKINIMKRIKENSILYHIPESDTIQHVIDFFYPAFFSTRNEVKYFLCILGDNLSKKKTSLIHYIHPHTKAFMKEINLHSQIIFGGNINQTFRFKYYDHQYSESRIVQMNSNIRNDNQWLPFIRSSILDILCVSSHYSMRYDNSDHFVEISNDDDLLKTAFFLKDIHPSDLVGSFIEDYLYVVENTISSSPSGWMRQPSITWKNIQYLWKHFLDGKKIPSVIFQSNLKTILISKLSRNYHEVTDSFYNISSHYLPSIQKFLAFWTETIILDDSETEFEIGEIILLIRKWCISKGEALSNLNEKQILDLITFYFPHIEIDKDKYIPNIRCSLWNKKEDIQSSLDEFRTLHSGHTMNIAIYQIYSFYCKKYSAENKLIVSKSYFEKYIYENFSDYIVDVKFLSMEWLKTLSSNHFVSVTDSSGDEFFYMSDEGEE
jgi:hypothetical protein